MHLADNSNMNQTQRTQRTKRTHRTLMKLRTRRTQRTQRTQRSRIIMYSCKIKTAINKRTFICVNSLLSEEALRLDRPVYSNSMCCYAHQQTHSNMRLITAIFLMHAGPAAAAVWNSLPVIIRARNQYDYLKKIPRIHIPRSIVFPSALLFKCRILVKLCVPSCDSE